jgi:hypothetical protein
MEKERVWYPHEKEGWALGELVGQVDDTVQKIKTKDGIV